MHIVPNALLTFCCKKKVDYHEEINHNHDYKRFIEWLPSNIKFFVHTVYVILICGLHVDKYSCNTLI